MLIIFNIIIAFLSIIPIIIIKHYPKIVHENHFKNHAIIFFIKLYLFQCLYPFLFLI